MFVDTSEAKLSSWCATAAFTAACGVSGQKEGRGGGGGEGCLADGCLADGCLADGCLADGSITMLCLRSSLGLYTIDKTVAVAFFPYLQA